MHFQNSMSLSDEAAHNSLIYDEGQTQSALVLALLRKQAYQDDSNDTPLPIGEC